MTINKQFITDAEKKPIAVVLNYLDWLSIEPIIEMAQKPTVIKPRRKRIAGLGMAKGQKIIMSDDFDSELPDSFWLGENDLV